MASFGSTISGSNPMNMSLAEKSAVEDKGNEAAMEEKAIEELRCIFSLSSPVYIPQCLNLRSLFQTSPFAMTTLKFQPLFRTPLLCMEPHQLPIGHPVPHCIVPLHLW